MEKHGGLVVFSKRKAASPESRYPGQRDECQSDVEVIAWEEVRPPYALACPGLS